MKSFKDHLNELSPQVLASYAKKALADPKRKPGVAKAIDKMAGVKPGKTVSVDAGIKELLRIANKALMTGQYADQAKRHNKAIIAKKLKKYTAIYNTRDGKVDSIHAFVDNETGDLLKAAGFRAPAKGARGNLTDPEFLKRLQTKFDQFGGYLYKR